MDELLALTRAPQEHPLLGFFCRCFLQLFNQAESILNSVIDIQAIRPEIERYSLLQQDIASATLANHELAGVLNQYYLYAIFTSTGTPDKDPIALAIIRAQLVSVLHCPQVALSENTLKVLSSITRNYGNYGANTNRFFNTFPGLSDPRDLQRTWIAHLQQPVDFPESWIAALTQLLSRFSQAYRWFQSYAYSQPRPAASATKTTILANPIESLLGPNRDQGFVRLGADFTPADFASRADAELAAADQVDTEVLIASLPVPIDESPPLSVVERSQTLISEQFSFQDFLAYSNRVLLPHEFALAMQQLKLDLRQAIKVRDLALIETNLLMQLTAATGWSLSTLLQLTDLDGIDEAQVVADPFLEGISIRRGVVVFRIPDVDKFWKPSAASPLYPITSERIQLQLPRSLVAGLQVLRKRQQAERVVSRGLFHHTFDQLQPMQLVLRQRLRAVAGLERLSLGRLRSFLPVRLFQTTHDTALVMLVSGQTHGFSTAPLHYYQTDHRHLQSIYRQALPALFPGPDRAGHFGGRRYGLPERVGSRLQLSDAEIADFVSGLLKPLRTRPKTLRDQLQLLNRLARYLTWMLLASTGHRDTTALGRLTVDDLLHEGGMALFSDKVTDAGHRARLVVLSTALCAQLATYRQICLGLSQCLLENDADNPSQSISLKQRRRLAQSLQAAASGHAGLLIQISVHGVSRPIANQDLYRDLPAHWGCKLNVFRHRLSTGLRNNGVFAEYVNHQMGHWDLGMQPFGRQSLLSPTAWVAALQPELDRLLVKDGWQSINTCLPKAEAIAPVRRLSFSHRDRQTELLKDERHYWRGQVKRRLGQKFAMREALERAVDQALNQVCSGYHRAYPPTDVTLSDQQLQQVVQQLLATVGEQADALTWRMDFLRRRLLRHRYDQRWHTPLPGKLFRTSVEPSPFFPGSLAAYRDCRQLQQWLLQQFPTAEAAASRLGISLADYRLIRLVLSLVLIGGYFDIDRLLAVLQGLRESVLRSQTLPGGLIVSTTHTTGTRQTVDAGTHAEILTGVCAAAAVAWLKSRPALIPEFRDLSGWIHALLPEGIKPAAKLQTLSMLAALAKTARRFESSGFSAAVECGQLACSALTANAMVSALDNQRYGEVDLAIDESSATAIELMPLHHAEADRFTDFGTHYRSLIHILYTRPDQVKTFALSGMQLPPTTFTHRLLAATVQEVRCWLTQSGYRPPILQALGAWVLRLLSDRGLVSGRGPLRISSAHTYLSRFASVLVDLVRNQPLYRMTGEDFEALYISVLQAKPAAQRPQALSSILRFHRFLVDQYGLSQIDSEALFALAGVPSASADAQVITPAQYQRALAIFDHWLEQSAHDTLIETAQLALICQYRFWLRSGEVQRLRLSDLNLDETEPYVRVATTHRGRTKSLAGKRIVPGHQRLNATEHQALITWQRRITALWQGEPPASALLFPDLRALEVSPDWQKVAQLIGCALNGGGSARLRPHHCRHSGYSYSLAAQAVEGEVFRAMAESGAFAALGDTDQASLRLAWQQTEHVSVRLVHQLAAAMGHASPTTGFEHYFHLHPLLQSPLPEQLWRLLDIQQQADWSNTGYAALRQRYARAKQAFTDARAALDYQALSAGQVKDPKSRHDADLPPLPNTGAALTTLDLQALASLLRDFNAGIPMPVLAAAYSLTPWAAKTLLSELSALQTETRYALIDSQRLYQARQAYEGQLPPPLALRPEKEQNNLFDRREFRTLLAILNTRCLGNSPLIARLRELFRDGYRVQQSELVFSRIESAAHYIEILNALALGEPQVTVEYREADQLSEIEDARFRRDISAQLAMPLAGPHFRRLPNARKKAELIRIKIGLFGASEQPKCVQQPLWQALMLLCLHGRCLETPSFGSR
ncbi:hypothetical protein ACH518_04015 [Methylomonas sp. HW2-6]|uniref:hypothetical protein n=1 Tax=Methylomonas sp. HW2-6 TaxID=3376687 RepID=UPI004042969D